MRKLTMILLGVVLAVSSSGLSFAVETKKAEEKKESPAIPAGHAAPGKPDVKAEKKAVKKAAKKVQKKAEKGEAKVEKEEKK